MSDSLYRYYESELYYIRKLAKEFARKYPSAAARLQLEDDRSADPHVERLIESFALLTGRVRNKLDDEFPELTDAMLSVVYPHMLAPVPAAAVVQFDLTPARGTPEGVPVPAGSPMHTARVGDQFCKFRTCYPLRLWPLAVTEAKLHPPPYPPGLNPPPTANAALRIRLRVTGELTLDKMTFDSLRLHLLGEPALTAPLYDLIFNHAIEVAVVDPDSPKRVAAFPADQIIRPVGFDPADALLPYPEHVFPGYRLLTEYFAYQPKFLFADLGGWDAIRTQVAPARQVELVIFLTRSHPRLEQVIEPGMFRLGCTPVVNLFDATAEPIPLTHARTEYRVVPAVGQPMGHEVYSIQKVTAAGATGKDREYLPFFRYRHGFDRHTSQAFWYAARRPSPVLDDRGTDVFLSLVDTAFDPLAAADDEAVVVKAVCTNRDLPTRLPRIGDEVRFEPAFASPGAKVRCVRNPTAPLRPPSAKGRYWHLISHLNLNHLPFTDEANGLESLKGILRLYDLTDPEAEPQAAALARQSIDGLVGVSGRRTVGWVGGGELGGMVRGVEVGIELDETKFVGNSGVLFASVLERFAAMSVSVNSFTRLVARFRQRDEDLKRWPPRAGDRPLV